MGQKQRACLAVLGEDKLSPRWLQQFILPPAANDSSCYSTISPACENAQRFNMALSGGCEVPPHFGLKLISLSGKGLEFLPEVFLDHCCM